MDGQNFENENNVTVDTTATEVSSAAETVQETPVTEQPVNNYQDYTANVQPQAAATAPVQQPENKETNVLAIVSLVLGILSIVLGCCTGWIGALFGIGYHLRSICQQAGQDRPGKGWTDLFYHWYCTGNYHYNLSCSIFCSIYE